MMHRKKNTRDRYAMLIEGIPILIAFIAITCIAFSVGTTESRWYDPEQNIGNSYGAWTSIQWTQTTQSDFEAGVRVNSNTSSSPGNVILTTTSINYTRWYSSSWNFRKKITIDHTKVAASQTNFPVLISLTTDADLASSALANGNDILFTSADGTTKLDHEIENFTVSNGKLIAWVRIPSLTSTVDTDLYMYFNNSGSSNQQNATGVWDATYVAVYHMSQSPAGTVYDSTSNRLNLTSSGGMGSGNLVSGQIGNGIYFDGNNDRLNTSGTFTTTNFTLEAWVSNSAAGSWPGWQAIVDLYDPTDPGNVFREFTSFPDSTNGWITLCDNAYHDRIIGRQSGTAWRHIGAAYYSPTGTRTGYINGISGLSSPSVGWGSINASISVGAWAGTIPTWSDWWRGNIDEVRISNNALSNQWIATEYNNTYSPSTFYTVGARTSPPSDYAPSGTIASVVFDTNSMNARWDALEWDEGLAGGTDITFDVRAADTSFVKENTTLAWTSVGGTSPVYAGLPRGRYFQWRATLTTADTAVTPTLNEVRVFYT